jgi:hypothetical protein
MSKQQSINYSEELFHFQCGTGKDAKIFVRFMLEEDGVVNLYNIPLLTLNSIQVFTSKPKIPRYVMGSSDPVALTEGIMNVSGYITATTPNETIGMIVRRMLKHYKPVKASNLEIDTDGIINIRELDELRHLDQLPLCQINIYISNPYSKKVFSKTIYGVAFNNESHTIGNSAAMLEQYSFMASSIGPIKLEELSETI